MSIVETTAKNVTLHARGTDFHFHASLVKTKLICDDCYIAVAHSDGIVHLMHPVWNGSPPTQPSEVIDLRRRDISDFDINETGTRIGIASALYQTIDVWELDEGYYAWIRRKVYKMPCYHQTRLKWLDNSSLSFYDGLERPWCFKRRKFLFMDPTYVPRRIR